MVSRNLLRYDRAMPNTRTTLLAAALITAAIGAPLAGPTIAIASAHQLPACQHEDGNPDGTACDWTDPNTGAIFHVQAHTYGAPECRDICLGA